MADTIPLLILDTVVLPGPGTEIYLDPTEAAALRAQWPDDAASGRAVALGARPPFAAPASGSPGTPGPLLAACVVGSGSLVGVLGDGDDGEGGDDGPRLLIQDMTRAKLASVSPVDIDAAAAAEPGAASSAPQAWRCEVAPWPLEAGARTGADVVALERRFLRLLLATADAQEPRAIEAPVRELTEASGAIAKLYVLADYLFEAPSARVHALTAGGVDALADQVEDALALMEEGVAVHPRALRGPLGAYARQATQGPVEDLERVVTTLGALGALVAAPQGEEGGSGAAHTDAGGELAGLAEAIEALAQAAQETAARAEALTRLLVRAGRGRRRAGGSGGRS